MCYNITIKTCFISCKTVIDGKNNKKSYGFHLHVNPVNKIVNIEKDNKQNLSEKVKYKEFCMSNSRNKMNT